MKHVYGPVPSRRLGFSLGIDLMPLKTCCFDCIYCQLGATNKKTVQRQEYFPVKNVISELKEFVGSGRTCDYITISGSGEPTLNSGIGDVICAAKSMSDIPVAVLTNSSMLSDSRIREDLSSADIILPSLDAVNQDNFEKINRPHQKIKASDMIEGLINLKREFDGLVWLEVMLVRGFNTEYDEIESMKGVIESIGPDKVHLNTVTRPAAEECAKPANKAKMKEISEYLGAQTISGFMSETTYELKGDKVDLVLDMLGRRPCTKRDVLAAMGLSENEAEKILHRLMVDGLVGRQRARGGIYYLRRAK